MHRRSVIALRLPVALEPPVNIARIEKSESDRRTPSGQVKLSPEQVRLLRETHLAYVATVNRDGSPQVTPVWVDTDGEAIIFNTARGRLKWRNLERDPRVAITVVDAANPETRVIIARGRAVLVEEGALEHIDRLSRKYDGKPWVAVPGQTRVIVRVLPDRITEAE